MANVQNTPTTENTPDTGNPGKRKFMLSLLAGMRVGEIAALKVGDVYEADGTVKDQIRLVAVENLPHPTGTQHAHAPGQA